jgi:hypothetical protein
MAFRSPTPDERRLLECLLLALHPAAVDLRAGEMVVESMNDGGMGSLHLGTALGGASSTNVHQIGAECRFKDQDGTDVIASLYVDVDGTPVELDVWKVTFEPLIRVPISLPRAEIPKSGGA